MNVPQGFKEKCGHCPHAAPEVPCCFCGEYINRVSGIIMRSSVPIVIHDYEIKEDQ
jgi:hypothetical protein